MFETATVFKFPGGQRAMLDQVGGKGYSLIKGSEAGLPVPPGFVLTVEFFRPWFEILATTAEWGQFINSAPEQMQAACTALKSASAKLTFSEAQSLTIAESLQAFGQEALFAVRSSSPEEDLEGASFAGGYETILGVHRSSVHSAVLRAFASCLDFRVAAYKKEHGFDASNPKIAVVVQEQIASAVAGVGFSINPLTNNFDEVVINANFGLGETVVGGLATPDTFVRNKLTGEITQKVAGGKETSIWLEANGGTIEKPAANRQELSLNDEQIKQLSELICAVEKQYGKPIDTEWALADNRFYLLQARPITAYVPLAPDMVTIPGAAKTLYMDVTIVVQGLYKPLSPMGTSILARLLKAAGEEVLGVNPVGPPDSSVAIIQNGRLYVNLSILLAIASKEKIATAINAMDPMTSRALAEASEAEYAAKIREGLHLPPLHLLLKLPEVVVHLIEARLLPEHAHNNTQKEIALFMEQMEAFVKEPRPIWELCDKLLARTFKFIFGHSIPLFIASRMALKHLQQLAHGTDEKELAKLERALPNNVTTEMGLSLYHLALLDPESHEYKEERSRFIKLYGHRGPEELDVAAPRYRDRMEMLQEQIDTLRQSAHGQDNPQSRFDMAKAEKEKACANIISALEKSAGAAKAREFKSLYRVYEILGGYREVHKYLLIFSIDLLRERLLEDGNKFVKEGRLSQKSEIFDLTMDDLKIAAADKKYDLQTARAKNREFSNRLAAVPSLPTLFDSRGRILRPIPSKPRPGEVSGTPISAGVVRGRIKVLHSPDEKPLLRGEILVARATDPGWTPLFVNAAAVILEIGGMLQHGALVAREYGLPCVSGIANATTLWQDGTLVEVDGSAGVIRVIEETTN
jgi:pyruvate,water dikinase